MTSKYLSGTYSAGYVLSTNYAAVAVGGQAFVQGTFGTAGANAVTPGYGTSGGPGGIGISLTSAGTVTNQGVIVGGTGGSGGYGNGTHPLGTSSIPNYGGAGGTGGGGIVLPVGGVIENYGTIDGGDYGTNGGAVNGARVVPGNARTGEAVSISGSAGFVTNSRSDALIQGYVGVELATGGAVTNAGTINGILGIGIKLTNGGSVNNSGIVTANGSDFPRLTTPSSAVSGYGVMATVISLNTAATIANSGTIYGNGGIAVQLNKAGAIDNMGAITSTASGIYLPHGGMATNEADGTIWAPNRAINIGYSRGLVAQTIRDAATIINNGVIITNSVAIGFSFRDIANNTIINYGTIEAKYGIVLGRYSTDHIVLGPDSALTGGIWNAHPGDTIDLPGVVATDRTYSSTTNLLTLQNGSQTVGTISLHGTNGPLGADFKLSSDGSGGTSISIIAPPAPNDFNNDGTSDILWRHSSGAVADWTVTNAAVQASLGVGNSANNWSIVGTGDFDGDGTTDLLWHDSNSGTAAIWEMQNGQLTASLGVGVASTNWHIVATGDFDGDGKSDILWRDANTGALAVWELNGAAVKSISGISTVSSDWVVMGTGDFNDDGKSDIVWQNTSTGTVAIWEMNGAQVEASIGLGNFGRSASVQGIGDFNNDGVADILWRDNGVLVTWEVQDGRVAASTIIGSVGPNWQIVGVSQNANDGRDAAGILFRDSNSGTVAVWDLEGGSVAASIGIGSAPSDWTIVHPNPFTAMSV